MNAERTAPYNRKADAQINVRLSQEDKAAFETAVGPGKMNEAILGYIRRTITSSTSKAKTRPRR